MLGLTNNATVFLLVVFALSMVLGTALDAVAVLTLTVPILQPLALLYDVDPIALGVLMIVSQMIGLLTPPVGTVIFVLQAISRATMSEVFWGSVPFLVPLIADLPGDHLLARRDPVPAREVGAVTGQAAPRSWLAGLIGQGVGPSLTPELHEREAQRQGLRYVYKVVEQPAGPLDRARLERLLASAIELGFDGLNVTHPVKQAMVPLVDDVDSAVESIGALNTVLIRGGRTTGHNTDVTGFLPGLRARAPRCRPRLRPAARRRRRRHRRRARPRAARRAAVARRRSGPRGGRRRSGVPSATLPIKVELAPVSRSGLSDALATSSGVVNASPMGMAAHPGSPVPDGLLRPDLWLADIVYRPIDTPLLRAAREAGCTVLNGAGMAVHQAADAFELITGRPADRTAMTRDFDDLVAAEATVGPSAMDPPRDNPEERNG